MPPVCAAGGGPVGRGVALPRSVSLPSLGRQQSGCHWRFSVHGGAWPPIPLRFVLVRLHWARSVRRRGALARAPLFSPVPVGARGWGGGAGRAPAPLSGGGRGHHPPCLGGWGPGPPRLAGRWGGGGGGSRRGLPAPPLGGGPRYPILAPLVLSAHSPLACACGPGRRAAPRWGGMRGSPWTAPPGPPADLNPPSALPEWAVVMGGSLGARPPYCSGAPPCAAPKLGPRIAPARWYGLACRPRPPREQAAGGAGARGVPVHPHPRPPASRSLLGEGGRALGSGGAEGRSCGSQAGGGGRGGGGAGGAAPPPPRPVGRRPAICCLRRAPPGYTRAVGAAGRPRAWSAVRSAANGSVRQRGGGGGGKPRALVRAPVFHGPASESAALFAPSWAPPVRRRPAAGRACGRLPRPWCPQTLGAAASSGGVRGRRFFGLPPSALGPDMEGGGGSGGGPLVPWRRLLTAEGGVAWQRRPRGPAIGWGVAPFPHPPLPRAGPSCRPSLGPSSPPPSSRGAGRPGAAVRVSGQRLAGCGAVGSPPRSLSPPSLPREVAPAPSSRCTVGGAWVGGPSSPPHFLASAVWPVTCAAACVGAGAVALAGCAGGSASGRGRCARPGGAICWRPHP